MARPQPLNERFADQYSQRASIRPSTGRIYNAKKIERNQNGRRGGQNTMRTTTKATGTAMQVGGATMQATGKVTKTAGKAAMRAGAAMSTTGVGAVVGVPLAALGGAAQATGSSLDAAGKTVRKVGGKVKKKAGGKVKEKVKNFLLEGDRINAISTTARMGTWSIPLYLFVQLPLAAIHLVLLGLAYGESRATDLARQAITIQPDDGIFTQALRGTLNFLLETGAAYATVVNDLMASVFNIDALGVLDAARPISLFSDMQMLIGIYTMALFSIIGSIYILAGVKPILGNGASIKIPVFMMAILFHLFPLLNIFPWFLFWCIAIVVKPK